MRRRDFLKRLPIAVAATGGVLHDLTAASAVKSFHGVAATVHPLATKVAIDTLKRGGNAVDAAIAAGLMLGVVDGFNSGIGGGCFMLGRRATGEFFAMDGREMAAAAATRDMYVRNGKAEPELSVTGALAPGVPGELAAFDEAQKRFGRLKLADVILPAADIAARGFHVSNQFFSRSRSVTKQLAKFPAAKKIFLRPDGTAHRAGDILKQGDLAHTYRMVAEQGIKWFYKGEFAFRAAKWMAENGGILTETDFAGYTTKLREPVHTTYRDFTIAGFPPPSSGGVHVAQILNILERFDLQKFGADSVDMYHVIIEAMKLAFADRAWWLGDPDFASVPRGLVDKAYAKELAARIDMNKAATVKGHGTPPNVDTDIFGKHTTHFTVADSEGNWVACTATINTTFGSKVVIPGTGVVLNNQMDDFSIQPGVPNSFGLLGNEANSIAAKKRPLSSMSPTIVTRNGQPVFSVGAAGGPTIISQVLLALVRHLDFAQSPLKLQKQARVHHQWRPDEVKLEKQAGASVIEGLKERGHKLKLMDSFGACQAIAHDADGTFTGAADPRVNGVATVL